MEEKIYRCICGKEFTAPNSFNGHKSHCKQHQISKYKTLDVYKQRVINTSTKCAEHQKRTHEVNLATWVSEQHTCETCGKVMLEKFATGRFCSKSCANTRAHSDSTKKQISLSVSKSKLHQNSTRVNKFYQSYIENPKLCKLCGNPLPYSKKYNIFCNAVCQAKFQSERMLKLCATMQKSLCGKGKRGWYKGYMCQSSWELAFVVYHIDHDIKIERNTQGFPYIWENKKHTYFPDFYLPGSDTYIEVKGFLDDKSKEKAKHFPKTLIIYNDLLMQDILQYVENKYGKDFTYLYDVDDSAE